jgi:hypothetical protein
MTRQAKCYWMMMGCGGFSGSMLSICYPSAALGVCVSYALLTLIGLVAVKSHDARAIQFDEIEP